jgi:hypothetical protein
MDALAMPHLLMGKIIVRKKEREKGSQRKGKK